MNASYDRPSSGRSLSVFVGFLLILLVGAACAAWWFWPRGGVGLNPEAQPRPVAARGQLAAEETTNISIYENASPAVVHVTNLAEQQSPFSLDLKTIPTGTG